MPKQTMSAEWKQFQDERKAKFLELVEVFDKKESELFKKVVSDFAAKFEAAVEVVKELPPACRKRILSVPVVKRFLKEYGAQPTKTEAKTSGKIRKTRKGKVTEEQILEFVATERTTEEIKKHFGGWSAPTFSKYLNPLVKAKKVSATDTRPKVYKRV